jgi:hypothetical protein
MKDINMIIQEVKDQLEQGTNGFEANIVSVDINDEHSLFIEEVKYSDDMWYHIELIHSESTEII